MRGTPKPNCYTCVHRREVPGSCHSRCNNTAANVTGDKHGISKGWFIWPLNFDPTWLDACDGLSNDPADALPEVELTPMETITMLFGKRGLGL